MNKPRTHFPPHPPLRRGVRISTFSREYQPSHGRCPACGTVQDESGCRVLRIARLDADGRTAPPPAGAPCLANTPALRALIETHPYVMDVECFDPGELAKQAAWERDHPTGGR